jgi:hypothetical protein
VVDVAHRADVDMRLGAIKMLLRHGFRSPSIYRFQLKRAVSFKFR